ncbi:SH3 domain protein, partial [Cooperia oncophora]
YWFVQVSVARAIYNNESEFDEELPFQRGDVLRVLSERPGQFINNFTDSKQMNEKKNKKRHGLAIVGLPIVICFLN